jgi:putrescine transport system substrate-binding protein
MRGRGAPERAPMTDAALAAISRRALLKRAGAGALSFGALPAVIAACGGDTNGNGSEGGATSASSGPAAAPTPSGTIDYFGWEGYELADLPQMKSYLADHGVKLRTGYIATLEDVPGRLRSGAGGIDLLGITNSPIPRFNQLDLLEPMDESKLPNLDGLLDFWKEKSSFWHNDQGQRIFVPLYFQTPGINYNAKRVDAPPERWQDLLEPQYRKKIGMWAEPNATIGLVTKMLGETEGEFPKSRRQDAVDLTRQFVEQSRTVAQTYGDLGNQLASGDIIATFVGFPVVQALARGAGGQGKDVRTNVKPQDGNFSFSDGYSIAVGADNVDAAYAFINEILDPKVQAEAAKLFNGGPVVAGAAELLSEAETTYPIDEYDAVLANASQNVVLPLESDEYLTQGEWIEEFQKLTS